MKTSALVGLILIFLIPTLPADESAQFKIINSEIPSTAGQSVEIQIETRLPKGFHIYADQLKLLKIEPVNYQTGQLKISPEIEFYDSHSQKNRSGFSDYGKILFQVESPEKISVDRQKIQILLRYQICSEQICYLPKNEPLEFELIYKTALGATQKSAGLFSNIETEFSKNIYWSIILVFLAGILTSFTPCIFPMIPITLSVLGHDAEKNSRSENVLKSVFYVLGIATTYSVLGATAAMTGSLFGSALSNKYVLAGIVILFIFMAFGMWGFFDLQMPAFIRNKLGASATGQKNYFGIFITGLFAGIVASPCVGPVLVSILSYVSTTQNTVLGFTLLFSYALGLGLIFILIGLFSQFLKFLPKSGTWMNMVKFIMGLLMICMAIYYLNFIFPVLSFLKPQSEIINTTANKKPHLNWIPYSEETLKRAKDNNRPVMIDFFAEWCAACHQLQDKTFSVDEFKQMSKDFDLVTVDATEDKAEIQKILKKYNIKGLPTVIFVNKKGSVIHELTFTQFLDWAELKPKLQKALEQ